MIETSPETRTVSLFDEMNAHEHEQVVFCSDPSTGLKAIIALHNTVLGPGMGGTRMWNYATEQEAVRDVLRLSRGMTFKNAIAGLNIGGGKAVIMGDVRQLKDEAFMRRFGRFVDSLGGRYWTAEDMNMTTRDMEYIRMETPYVAGLPESMGGSGDPSPVTAYGVYMGMKAAAKEAYGSDSLVGKKVVVQGTGHVGSHLVDYLIKEGAKVGISDIFEEKVAQITKKHKVEVIASEDIYHADMDIYAPCAMGATLNDETISDLRCAVVAGGANNQLDQEDKNGEMLRERGIIYAPDFLINSGGITNVYYEQQGNHNRDRVMAQTERIYDVCLDVIGYAEKNQVTTHKAALDLAVRRIEKIGKVKLTH